MKRALCAMALLAIGVVGCKSNKTSRVPQSDSVTDVTAPSPAPVSTYQPAPQPVAQPVSYDATNTQTPGTMAGGSYTVKKGATLYSIARNRYGSGKEWSKITAANPGLRPESLKVGQTIVVP